jgi:hypothetical protein
MRRSFLLGLCVVAAVCVAACGGRPSNPPPQIVVTISPTSATVTVGQTKQFTGTVTGTTNTAVTWQVNGVAGGTATFGTITTTGLYKAPAQVPNPATVMVTAVSQANTAKSASASVTVATQVAVAVIPSSASVEVFTSQQFSATVNGVPSTAVTWQVNGVTGGTSATGTISSSGLYQAPGAVPTKSDGSGGTTTTTVTVNAVSQANPNASGSATVTVFPPNKQSQAIPIKLGSTGGNANDFTTSVSTITCCGGTLGSLVARGANQYILSNNHVLAKSDAAMVGDSITHPGLPDNQCRAATTVAHLTQFFNLENGPTPKVDAAIAQVVSGAVDSTGNILLLGATATNGIPDPGAPHGGAGVAPTVSRAVAKSGRTTGLTCSTIQAINTTTSIKYSRSCGGSTSFTTTFTNQIVVAGGSFSAAGDSGSLIVTKDTADPVALLYAGSDTNTVGNPIADVLNALADTSTNPPTKPTFVGGGAHTVLGCTGTLPLSVAATTQAMQAVSSESLLRATAVRDVHAAELMAPPEVQALGVGASLDNPGEPAILFFVTRGQPRTGIPPEVDGVRTRMVEGDLFARRGVLSAAESGQLEQTAGPAPLVSPISDAEVERARIVHAKHVDELMSWAGVQGVGITSSVDAPGEAALMIFLIRGVAHPPIPVAIDGLRTRVQESSRFQAGLGDGLAQRACPVPATAKKRPRPPAHSTKH